MISRRAREGPQTQRWTTRLCLMSFGLLLTQTVLAQQIAEFSLPKTTLATEIVAGPDGNLWFASLDGIGNITTSGVSVMIPTAGSIADLTFDHDGNLWFTENVRTGLTWQDKIGRLSKSGLIEEFALPAEGRDPYSLVGSIVAGPDGNIWFTETGGRIGRITQAGSLTEFLLDVGVGAITAGPDGNLWFTASDGVERISPTGVVTEVAVFGGGGGITFGPDGALWVAGEGMIWRITTGGLVSTFVLPQYQGLLRGICSGPDGNLWFTEPSGPFGPIGPSKIGRITTAGVITESQLPDPWAFPLGITSGPDGNLWVVEQYSNRIARISPSWLPPPAPPPPPPPPCERRCTAIVPFRLRSH